MVQRILFVLCLSLFTLTTTSLQAAPSKPTAKQLARLSEVARCERGVPKLSLKQRLLVKKLIGHMKTRDVKGARKVWAKLRKHPKSAYLLNHGLFHGIVVPQNRVAKFAREYRFYHDQERRLAKHLKKLRKLRKRVGVGKVMVRRLRLAKYRAGGVVATEEGSFALDEPGVSDAIEELESMQERVRNKRQQYTTSFENFDQKTQQLYRLLSSVMKAMKAMRTSIDRNRL